MASHPQIVLFHYPFSPWSRKVRFYMALRNIPYVENIAPAMLPRPVFESLGVSYRRIPVLAIGKDLYTDTALIIPILDNLYPASDDHPAISAAQTVHLKDDDSKLGVNLSGGDAIALEHLLEIYTEASFHPAAETIPGEVFDGFPGFSEDREKLWGRKWTKEEQAKRRPEGMTVMRANFDFLENLLGNGREWIGGSKGPLLADIHAAWCFSWILMDFPGALSPDLFNKVRYPKTMEYLWRYRDAFDKAIERHKVEEVDNDKAVSIIESADFNNTKNEGPAVDEKDQYGLSEGAEISVYPKGTSSAFKDTGKLVLLNGREIAVEKKTKNGVAVRVHYPRTGIKIETGSGDADNEPGLLDRLKSSLNL